MCNKAKTGHCCPSSFCNNANEKETATRKRQRGDIDEMEVGFSRRRRRDREPVTGGNRNLRFWVEEIIIQRFQILLPLLRMDFLDLYICKKKIVIHKVKEKKLWWWKVMICKKNVGYMEKKRRNRTFLKRKKNMVMIR